MEKKTMFHWSVFVFALLTLSRVEQIDGLQCYKCGCFIIPGETTCTDDSELRCVIQYVQDSYCYILRTAGEVEFGHNLNSDLVFLESLHYIRATEEFAYSKANGSWLAPRVTQVSYGCDWNLCNTPRILALLPGGFSYAVDTNLLTSLLVPGSNESLTSCLSCSQCVNSTAAVNCPSVPCNGTCLIDDHIDDPQFNTGECSLVFESVCVENVRSTTVHITGNYYIDEKLSDITEIDIYCGKSNCNDPTNIQAIQSNTSYTVQLSNQLYFRPPPFNTTLPGPGGEITCYKCYCMQEVGSNDCEVLNCTTESRNDSYCEIVRDFKEDMGYEIITLGHVEAKTVRYAHSIRAEEKLILNENSTWSTPLVDEITYICDWPLCNDPRVVSKLTTSFQFNAPPTDIAQYLQGYGNLTSCLECSLCTNNTEDFENCTRAPCASDGHCFIEEYIDDSQTDDCEYAFTASCQPAVNESSIIVIATYNIDEGQLDIDTFDVYCSKDDCNTPSTVFSLIDLLSKDIQLDPLYFFRPVNESDTTTTTSSTTTSPIITVSTSTTVPTTSTSRSPTSTTPPGTLTSTSGPTTLTTPPGTLTSTSRAPTTTTTSSTVTAIPTTSPATSTASVTVPPTTSPATSTASVTVPPTTDSPSTTTSPSAASATLLIHSVHVYLFSCLIQWLVNH